MDISIYYQVLDMGIQYEKGRRRGSCWRFREKKILRNEVDFWIKVLGCISSEFEGVDCSMQLFEMLTKLCKSYCYPNYELILNKKNELIRSEVIFQMNSEYEQNVRNIMGEIFNRLLQLLRCCGSKKEFYLLLALLHNLPKSMHGKNILCERPKIVSYEAALGYANSYLNTPMLRKKYGNIVNI